MKLSQFKFNFNESLIAKHPSETRHDSKLMVLNREKNKIEHKKFSDILNYFDDRDVFINNNTKVFPARLYGSKEKQVRKLKCFCCAS
jgi:S-adenosylmethionine:tRNA ribosyltransferase-isomerase